MTQENRELLLKDLCARLPYGVKGKCELDASYDTSFDTVFQTHKFDAVVYGLTEDSLFVTPLIEDEDEQSFAEEEVTNGIDILDFTPYLFPLSSMTEGKKKEYYNLCIEEEREEMEFGEWITRVYYHNTTEAIDWLNKNHFDYRGLIKKGLAIDCTNLDIY